MRIGKKYSRIKSPLSRWACSSMGEFGGREELGPYLTDDCPLRANYRAD